MEPLCMSWSRSGMTKDRLGSAAGSPGKALNGRFADGGTDGKFTHGACLRAYAPSWQTGDPGEGSPSEEPAKLRPASISDRPRLRPSKVCGHESSWMPWMEPQNRAR